jgi:glycosyltransferase involved in cell wall biosynthesis
MMTPRPIIYDAARLFLSATSATPRGIDRVEIEYARALNASWPGEVFALLPTPWGLRLFDRARFTRAVEYLEHGWSECGDVADDPVFGAIASRLAGQDIRELQATPVRKRGDLVRLLGLIATTGFSLGRSHRRVGRNAIYLNIGQLGWTAWLTTPWLARRPDIACVFMLHDVIQLERPEFVTRQGLKWARVMVDIVRKRATALIATTAAAHRSVLAALGRTPASLVLPLPLAEVFTTQEPPDAALAAHTYFICCGSVEPRKNHLLLLHVWQTLIARHGAAAPKLVIVGPVVPRGAAIRDQLQASPALRRHIIIASGLTSPALRRLVTNARASLTPSFTEGFGLPVIEALALKTPVVLSDIAPLREAAAGLGIYHHPDDVAAWTDTIERLTFDPDAAACLRRDCAAFQPMTGAHYFAIVQDFLRGLPVPP